ncbi:MAG: 3-hydroxyacyl-CoA dehydrogenase NAD-binding domain-containing protein, partial [Lawsonibacter sp.]|nr:3-hydroxyacyl-CoA dehydrogenase NAD-binding domain-containing protein [Lawsonibacter sp.]
MDIQNIFVVGAGLMGSGIAQTALQSGYTVTLNDQREEALDRAKAGINSRLDRLVEKGILTREQRDDCMSRLTTDTRLSAASNADLVIEAIFEQLAAKSEVFQALDRICGAQTIFASNTSSISLTALAAATNRPEKVVGMHFFSPVPVMRLLEIVCGLRTSQEVLDTVKDVGKKMGK